MNACNFFNSSNIFGLWNIINAPIIMSLLTVTYEYDIVCRLCATHALCYNGKKIDFAIKSREII